MVRHTTLCFVLLLLVGMAGGATLTVTNTGGCGINVLTSAPFDLAGRGSASLVAGPNPPQPVILAEGASVTFTWTYTTTSAGSITFSTTVSGTEAVSGQGIALGPVVSNPVVISPLPPANSADSPSQPSGPGSGPVGSSLAYATSAVDPDGDQEKYGWDWDGDGTVDEWSGYVASGTTDSRSHAWATAGTYSVRVRAEDAHGAQSGWSPVKIVVIQTPAPPASDQTLYVYPHPLKCPGGNAVFKMDKDGTATLRITNMRGQIVKEITRSLSASPMATVSILCTDVKNGAYMIQCELKFTDGTTKQLKPYKFIVAGGR